MVRVITALSGLVLVVLVLRLAMVPLFPLDKFVGPAVAAFEAKTGTVMKFGDVDIELLPTPRIVAADVAIELPDGLGDMHADRLALVLRPLPLLSGSAELDGVTVERPELRLALKSGDLDPAKVIGVLADLTGRAAAWNFLATDGELALSAGGTQTLIDELTASAVRTGDGDRLILKAMVDGTPLSLTVEAGAAGVARARLTSPALSLGVDGGLAGGAFAGRLDLLVPDVVALGGPFADVGGSIQLDGAVPLALGRAQMVEASAAVVGGNGRLSVALDLGLPRPSVDLHADFGRLPADSLAGLAALAAHLGFDPTGDALPFDAGVDLKVAELALPGGSIRSARLTAIDRDGHFGALFDGAAGNGTLSGRLDIVPDGDGRRLGGSVTAKNVAVRDVAALAGLTSPVAGRLNADFHLSARGRSTDELAATLAVDGGGQLRGGYLDELPLAAGIKLPALSELSTDLVVTSLDKPARLFGQATVSSDVLTIEATVTPRHLIDGGVAPVVIRLDGPMLSAGFDGGIDPVAALANGNLNLASRRLSELSGVAGLPENASLDGRLEVGVGRLTLSDARLMLDDGAFGGLLDLATAGERGRLTGRLSGDTVDVVALAAALSGPMRNVAGALDADLRIEASRIATGLVAAAGGPVDIRLGGKGAEIGLPRLSLGGGSGSATLTVTGGDRPMFAVKGELEGARLASLAPLVGAAADGELSLSADVTAEGAARADLLASATGTADFSLSHGVLYGLDPVALIGRLAHSVQTGFGSDSGRFGFDDLSGRLRFEKGAVTSRDLAFAAGGLKLSGSGNLGLAKGVLDLRLEPELKGYPAFEVPVAVIGPLAKPRLYPDLPGLVGDPAAGYARLATMAGGFSRFLGTDAAPKLPAVSPDAMMSMIDRLSDAAKPAAPLPAAPLAAVPPQATSLAATPPTATPAATMPPVATPAAAMSPPATLPAAVPLAVILPLPKPPTTVPSAAVPPLPVARPSDFVAPPQRERMAARSSILAGGPLDLGALGRASSVAPASAPSDGCRPGRDGRCIP